MRSRTSDPTAQPQHPQLLRLPNQVIRGPPFHLRAGPVPKPSRLRRVQNEPDPRNADAQPLEVELPHAHHRRPGFGQVYSTRVVALAFWQDCAGLGVQYCHWLDGIGREWQSQAWCAY